MTDEFNIDIVSKQVHAKYPCHVFQLNGILETNIQRKKNEFFDFFERKLNLILEKVEITYTAG